MKSVLRLIFLLIFVVSATARAATVPELFDAGVSEYRQGNFDRSAEIFLDLYEKYNVKSPDLLTNLGAAQFAAGKTGPAMTHLLKAIRLTPDSRAAQTAEVNLDRIRSLLNERQNTADKSAYVFGAYTDAWTALFSWLDARLALLIFLGCWITFFAGLAARRLFPRRTAVVIIAITASLTVLSGLGAYASDRVESYRTGVVLIDRAAVMDDVASTQATVQLPEGLEFRVLEIRGSWVRVRLASGLTGWMAEQDVGIP